MCSSSTGTASLAFRLASACMGRENSSSGKGTPSVCSTSLPAVFRKWSSTGIARGSPVSPSAMIVPRAPLDRLVMSMRKGTASRPPRPPKASVRSAYSSADSHTCPNEPDDPAPSRNACRRAQALISSTIHAGRSTARPAMTIRNAWCTFITIPQSVSLMVSMRNSAAAWLPFSATSAAKSSFITGSFSAAIRRSNSRRTRRARTSPAR